jgi:hypothetical protein
VVPSRIWRQVGHRSGVLDMPQKRLRDGTMVLLFPVERWLLGGSLSLR